ILLPAVIQISEPPITAEDGIFVRPEPSPETLVVVKTPTFAVPCTSSLYRGVFVPIPTFEVWVSTNKLATPTSRLEDVYTFPSTWTVACGVLVRIPTFDVWVSTNRLARPISKFEVAYTFPSTWRLASTGFAPMPTLPKL